MEKHQDERADSADGNRNARQFLQTIHRGRVVTDAYQQLKLNQLALNVPRTASLASLLQHSVTDNVSL